MAGGKSVTASLLWKMLERFSVQGVSFIVSLILARLLSPSEYGSVSLILVFTNLATVFVQGGFNMALIQKPNVTETDKSTVFFISLGVAALLYVILFFAAPAIASFYEIPELEPATRALSLILFPGALNSVQTALASKAFMFRAIFTSSLIAVGSSAIVGIALAWWGAGMWALVAQQLTNQVLVCLVMWFAIRWVPSPKFSLNSAKRLFSFGSRVLGGNLLNTFFQEARSLIIGGLYSVADLAFFARGRQFPQTIMSAVNGSLQSVMFPAFSKMQGDRGHVLSSLRRSVQVSNYIIHPAMIALAIVAEPLVVVLLTDKWLEAAQFVQIFALAYVFQPIQILSAEAMRGIGDSKTTLHLEVLRKIFEIAILLASIPFGVFWIAFGTIPVGFLSMSCALKKGRDILGYSIRDQIVDFAIPILISAAPALLGYGATRLIQNDALAMLAGVAVFFIGYIAISIVSKNPSFGYVKERLLAAMSGSFHRRKGWRV